MKRYQIYRKRVFGMNGKSPSGLSWVPFSSRLYKTRSYVGRKVSLLNQTPDCYIFKVVTVEQELLSL